MKNTKLDKEWIRRGKKKWKRKRTKKEQQIDGIAWEI